MRRPVFLSFCYDDDVTRVQLIRNMGMVEEQQILSPNDFEQVRRSGDAAIKRWIDNQLMYKQCVIVLVGENTANRPYVRYEIMKAKEKKIPMFGIYIHNLKDLSGRTSRQGKDPFVEVLGYNSGYKCINPSHIDIDGCRAYNTIKSNISSWIEDAIRDNKYRSNYYF